MCWRKDKFRIPNFLDGAASIMLDSGAFTYKNGGFPYNWSQYLRFVIDFHARYPQTDCFAVMDRFAQGMATSDINQKYGAWEGLPANPIMIIQGETLEDYVNCLEETYWLNDDFEENYPGLWQHLSSEDFDDTEFEYSLSPLIGIGNIAGRNHRDEVFKILKTIRHIVGDTQKIHVLGLKYRFWRDDDIRNQINQADSGIWRFGTTKRFPSNHTEKIENLHAFDKKLSNVFAQQSIAGYS